MVNEINAVALMKNEVDLIKIHIISYIMINIKLEANDREYNLFSVKLETFAAIKMLCGGLVSAQS